MILLNPITPLLKTPQWAPISLRMKAKALIMPPRPLCTSLPSPACLPLTRSATLNSIFLEFAMLSLQGLCICSFHGLECSFPPNSFMGFSFTSFRSLLKYHLGKAFSVYFILSLPFIFLLNTYTTYHTLHFSSVSYYYLSPPLKCKLHESRDLCLLFTAISQCLELCLVHSRPSDMY